MSENCIKLAMEILTYTPSHLHLHIFASKLLPEMVCLFFPLIICRACLYFTYAFIGWLSILTSLLYLTFLHFYCSSAITWWGASSWGSLEDQPKSCQEKVYVSGAMRTILYQASGSNSYRKMIVLSFGLSSKTFRKTVDLESLEGTGTVKFNPLFWKL